jgi:predicted NACHT family NTPase
MTEDAMATRPRPDLTYTWPRFWVPRDGTIDLSDAGFLQDPSVLAGPQGPTPLAALQDWRALALLGEPGIGKSTTLKEEADRVAALPAATRTVPIYVDLRAFSNESLLYARVFEGEKFIAWKNGTSYLFLHLDSLDEALLRIDSIANLLASELPGSPTERMSIRIACRTAVWPAATLGAALISIWGETSGAFELAPLRRRDLFTALDAHGIAVEGFMRALFAAQAVPFAIKPLTLKMLLTIYRQRGDLPNSSIDLYKQGCLALCEEQNKSRRDSGRRGRLNAGQRMRLAGRIAAATILGNRFAVWTGPEVNHPSENIPVSELAGRREQGEFAAFYATDDDVREVLDTGLFSSRGEGRMGWSHQGYGEFLAAFYLFERGVPAETMLKALLHPAGGLVPQLSVIAAWAASLSGG